MPARESWVDKILATRISKSETNSKFQSNPRVHEDRFRAPTLDPVRSGSVSVWMALIAVLAFTAAPRLLADNAECLACHSDKTLTKKAADGSAISLFVDEAKYAASVHGQQNCTACHTDAKPMTEIHAARLPFQPRMNRQWRKTA